MGYNSGLESKSFSAGLSDNKIRFIMTSLLQNLLEAPVRYRPIAAAAVDLNTGEGIHVTTNRISGLRKFVHAEEQLLSELLLVPNLGNNLALFVTREPCTIRNVAHHTPCADLIIASGKIKKVYILDEDPNSQIKGKGVAKLKESGIITTLLPFQDLREKQDQVWQRRENIVRMENLQDLVKAAILP